MQIIQPHYHAIARTAQDYERMAMSGVVAVCEPAFWAGFDRHYPETFIDYFRQITEFEPTRAADYGIRHFSWVAVNPVGETGLHKSTPNECDALAAHVELAMKHDQLVLIHTPHLSDKAHGTQRTLEILAGLDVNPERIWIDHVEEQTVKSVLDAGYWAGMTLYPVTKCSPKRAVDILERYGTDKLLVNSSADWGPSDPFTLQQCVVEYRRRGHSLQEAVEVFHNNPCRFLGQNPKWDIKPIRIETEA